jgi:CO/xanthine dehydrogenase Mo-binding subunit
MQLGMTLSEELIYEDGQLTNAGLAFYRVPGLLDLPASFESHLIDFPAEGDAPFGAKGVGESGGFAVAPAIANALYDAAGVRINDLPLTSERIWQALSAPAPVAGGGVD